MLRIGNLSVDGPVGSIALLQRAGMQCAQVGSVQDLPARGIDVRTHTPQDQVVQTGEVEDDAAVGDDPVEVRGIALRGDQPLAPARTAAAEKPRAGPAAVESADEFLRRERRHVRCAMTEVGLGLRITERPHPGLAVCRLVAHVSGGHRIAAGERIIGGVRGNEAAQPAATLLQETSVPVPRGHTHLETDLRCDITADDAMCGQRWGCGDAARTAHRNRYIILERQRLPSQRTARVRILGACAVGAPPGGKQHRQEDGWPPQPVHRVIARRPARRPKASAGVSTEPFV